MHCVGNLRFDTMGRGDDVLIVDQSTSADVNRFLGVLLQDGNLPWVFTELAVTVDVDRILDATVDALRVADATLAQVGVGRLLWRAVSWTTTANAAGWALLLLLRTSSEVRLTLLVKRRIGVFGRDAL